MGKNFKNIILFIVLIVVPMLIAFINWKYSTYYNFNWGYRNTNVVSFTSLIIALVGSVIIIITNRLVEKLWFYFGIILFVLLLTYLYLTLRISNFGF